MKKMMKLFVTAILCGGMAMVAHAQRASLAMDKATANEAMMADLAKGKSGVSAARITEALDNHLTVAVTASKRYTVVDRKNLAKIIEEQKLGESGLVSDDAAQMGNLRGAAYVLTTTLDHILESQETVTFGEVTKIKRRYQLSGQATIIDANTSEIIDASNIQIEKYDIMDAVPGASDGGSSRLGALLPEITREFAEKTVSRLLAVTFPAKVLRVSGKVLDINQGEGFFKKGDRVDVYGEDEVIFDEDSGEEFRLTGDIIGTATITLVTPQTSKATFNGSGEVPKGARVMKKE
ncbi:MAG: hypothetical protein FWF84_03870 [Kiritimatiellaeota bacterium]|nr:hypothetical protein [Kiritimatiellota bacterium]